MLIADEVQYRQKNEVKNILNVKEDNINIFIANVTFLRSVSINFEII